MKKRIKINGIIIFFAFLLLILFPKLFFRNDKSGSFDTIIEASGLALILLGQLIRVSGPGFKAENSGKGGVLIKNGPYAFVRNPMYLGIFLIGLGIVLILFQWWVAAVFIIIFIIRYVSLIFTEEKKLKALFPNEFPCYKQKVPRILPSIILILKADITEYLPLKLSWLRKEIGSILTVLFIVLFLESWQDIRNKGLAGYIKEAIVMLVIILFFSVLIIYLSKCTQGKNVSNKSQINL